MKNVKKLLALGLASAMTLSLASCGNENNNPATGNEGSNASNVTENTRRGEHREQYAQRNFRGRKENYQYWYMVGAAL